MNGRTGELLDTVADWAQPAVDAVVKGDDPAHRLASDALHGTWLGHPLHPLLTDIPIGAWTVGALADVLALGGDVRAAYTADVATTIGVAGAVAAAWAGWADWSDTEGKARRTGIAHALINASALSLYVASLALRRGGKRRTATAIALAGYAIVGAGAYLGAELSFGMHIGMRQTAVPMEPPADFTRVAGVRDVPGDGVLGATFGGEAILLARVGDVVHAVGGACTHRGAPLAAGERRGDCITCPWHGSRFALRDGRVEGGPATFALTAYETRVDGDDVAVRTTPD